MLITRQQIHHGYDGNRQQCDTRRTHQELQGRRAHASVQNNDIKTVTSRNDSKKTHNGQEVSEALKTIIQDEYKMHLELVSLGTHRRNAAEVAIRNFKSH